MIDQPKNLSLQSKLKNRQLLTQKIKKMKSQYLNLIWILRILTFNLDLRINHDNIINLKLVETGKINQLQLQITILLPMEMQV